MVDQSENHFNNRYPYISFEKDIRPYFQAYKDDVERNMVECVKEFFKKNYQKYKIQFSECSLALLAKYLEYLDRNIDVENKNNVGEILVLYLLSFKSDSLQRSNFVFEDMGPVMFKYDEVKPEAHNKNLETIINFIETNYNEMDEELFVKTTGKKIKEGNKKIIEELKHQLELGKRF